MNDTIFRWKLYMNRCKSRAKGCDFTPGKNLKAICFALSYPQWKESVLHQ